MNCWCVGGTDVNWKVFLEYFTVNQENGSMCGDIYVIFLGVFSVSGNTPSVRLCFRNIFSMGYIVTDAHPSSISLTVMDSMGKIVTDAHLTVYSVLFPFLLSHTYYSSLSLLRMHKLHFPILYPIMLYLWVWFRNVSPPGLAYNFSN